MNWHTDLLIYSECWCRCYFKKLCKNYTGIVILTLVKTDKFQLDFNEFVSSWQNSFSLYQDIKTLQEQSAHGYAAQHTCYKSMVKKDDWYIFKSHCGRFINFCPKFRVQIFVPCFHFRFLFPSFEFRFLSQVLSSNFCSKLRF